MRNKKDGVDAKGEGSIVSMHESSFEKNARHVQVSGGGTAECTRCEFVGSGADGVAAMGKDTMLKLVSCNVKVTASALLCACAKIMHPEAFFGFFSLRTLGERGWRSATALQGR